MRYAAKKSILFYVLYGVALSGPVMAGGAFQVAAPARLLAEALRHRRYLCAFAGAAGGPGRGIGGSAPTGLRRRQFDGATQRSRSRLGSRCERCGKAHRRHQHHLR